MTPAEAEHQLAVDAARSVFRDGVWAEAAMDRQWRNLDALVWALLADGATLEQVTARVAGSAAEFAPSNQPAFAIETATEHTREVELAIWQELHKPQRRALLGGLMRALQIVRTVRGVDPDDNSLMPEVRDDV